MCLVFSSLFFFNDTATTEIYTLSLHDALPILTADDDGVTVPDLVRDLVGLGVRVHAVEPVRISLEERLLAVLRHGEPGHEDRSEEHTSELQSRQYLVCRLLLEKKK